MDIEEVLQAVPDSLRPVIKGKLEALDKSYQDQLNEANETLKGYEPFKVYVENNIAPDYLEQAVRLADELQRDPQTVIGQINEAWNLGFVSAEEAKKVSEGSNAWDDDDDDSVDITKHPQFVEMQSALEQMQSRFDEDVSTREEEEALKEFEAELDKMEADAKSEGKPFNRLFVTALMANDISSEDALKEFYNIVGENVQLNDNPGDGEDGAPVVMGGNGSGSGSPDGTVDFGSMSKNDVNSTVMDLLKQQSSSGQ